MKTDVIGLQHITGQLQPKHISTFILRKVICMLFWMKWIITQLQSVAQNK